MKGIREKILDLTFKQCLKLLKDDTVAYHTNFPNGTVSPSLSETERGTLEDTPPILENVRMGGFPLAHVTRLTRVPALYVANGIDAVEVGSSQSQFGSQNTEPKNFRSPPALQKVLELYPIVLRLVVNQGSEPDTDKSNPIIIAHIREQFDTFLNTLIFQGLKAKRFGYTLPSEVKKASLTASYPLENIPPPISVQDFRFEVVFEKQRNRETE